MLKDRVFKTIAAITAAAVMTVALEFAFVVVTESAEAFRTIGFSGFVSYDWNPSEGNFGFLGFAINTAVISLIALAAAFPISLIVATHLHSSSREGVISSLIRRFLGFAGNVPSVVYGLWALTFLRGPISSIASLLGYSTDGVGIATATVVLAIMITPHFAGMTLLSLESVPNAYVEAARALGASRYEIYRNIIFPAASRGIVGSAVASLGKAAGETVAVAMTIGLAFDIPRTIFSEGQTLTSVLANQFLVASSETHFAVLYQIAILLAVIGAGAKLLTYFILQRNAIDAETADL